MLTTSFWAWTAGVVIAGIASSGRAAETVPLAPTPAGTTNAVAAARAPERDLAAGKFMNTCAGCHSLSGVKLTGPELSHVATWPEEQLKQAIKRMEQRVGPLADSDIAALADLLRSANVRDRLKAEETRIQAQFMAKLEPASAETGRRLFFGEEPLKDGGLHCAACHAVAGQGGNLGPDLTAVFFKMGETPLISAIEKASFKVMEPHYRWRPVTKQEAVHLAKFFSTLDPKTAQTAKPTFVPLGAGSALAVLVGLVVYFRGQRHGRDNRLQRRRK